MLPVSRNQCGLSHCGAVGFVTDLHLLGCAQWNGGGEEELQQIVLSGVDIVHAGWWMLLGCGLA